MHSTSVCLFWMNLLFIRDQNLPNHKILLSCSVVSSAKRIVKHSNALGRSLIWIRKKIGHNIDHVHRRFLSVKSQHHWWKYTSDWSKLFFFYFLNNSAAICASKILTTKVTAKPSPTSKDYTFWRPNFTWWTLFSSPQHVKCGDHVLRILQEFHKKIF